MTICQIYVGDLDDPTFTWDGDWNGNVPARLSPEFPSTSAPYNAAFHAWVEAGGVACEQTDFGGWVARTTKQQIIKFIADTYRGKEELPWVADRLPALNQFVATLLDNHEYALVATEW